MRILVSQDDYHFPISIDKEFVNLRLLYGSRILKEIYNVTCEFKANL